MNREKIRNVAPERLVFNLTRLFNAALEERAEYKSRYEDWKNRQADYAAHNVKIRFERACKILEHITALKEQGYTHIETQFPINRGTLNTDPRHDLLRQIENQQTKPLKIN